MDTLHIDLLLFLSGHHILGLINAACFLQTVRDGGPQCLKSLFRNKKELCSVGLEQPSRDVTRLTEVCHPNGGADIRSAQEH